jgi:hypothetical protein
MNHMIAWIATAALLTLGACNKKSENPPPAPAGSASDSSTAAAGSGATMNGGAAAPGTESTASATATTAAADVPTEMDFEDDATAKITDKNVESLVQAMEKELEQK